MALLIAGSACGVLALAVILWMRGRGEASPATGAAKGVSRTVLLVDDEQSVIGVAARILESGGYRVLAAGSAEEALAIVQAEPGNIDLLLTDINLPKKTGRQLADAVSAARPAAKVLFMSGYTDVPALQQKISDERLPFLQKPFTKESLLEAAGRAFEA